MRRYYNKKKYNKPYYDSHTFNSYRDEIQSYIRKEFFNVDRSTFLHIASQYKSLYGQKPYSYLLEAYDLWRLGKRKVADQTMEKILKCVPKYLSKEKKIFILKLEIIQFIARKQKKYENKKVDCNKIDDLYIGFFNSIEELDENDLRWFVKEVFTKTEIEKFIEISKYVVKKKLEQSYHNVKSDLKILYPVTSQLSLGIESQYYMIDFFKASIDLRALSNIVMKLGERGIQEPIFDENIDEEMLTHLVSEILKLNYIQEVGSINQKISQNDLSILLKSYNNFIETDNDVDINSRFQGKGGIFSIKILLKSVSKLRQEFIFTSSKTIAYILGQIFLIFIFMKYELYKINGFVVLLFIGFSIFILFQVYSEYNKSKILKKEMIKYGTR